MGMDELGSGEVGIKRGITPAGDIPLVSVDETATSLFGDEYDIDVWGEILGPLG